MLAWITEHKPDVICLQETKVQDHNHGVAATYPGTYGAMALLLCAIAAAASWIPARRAVRIDPIVVLREESVTA